MPVEHYGRTYVQQVIIWAASFEDANDKAEQRWPGEAYSIIGKAS